MPAGEPPAAAAATALAVDASGNLYVTGLATGIGSGWDWATIKYSTVGAPLWANIFNGAANDDDAPSALAVDTNGNVYVTGTFTSNNGGHYDWATIKYSTEGVALWTNTFRRLGERV